VLLPVALAQGGNPWTYFDDHVMKPHDTVNPNYYQEKYDAQNNPKPVKSDYQRACPQKNAHCAPSRGCDRNSQMTLGSEDASICAYCCQPNGDYKPKEKDPKEEKAKVSRACPRPGPGCKSGSCPSGSVSIPSKDVSVCSNCCVTIVDCKKKRGNKCDIAPKKDTARKTPAQKKAAAKKAAAKKVAAKKAAAKKAARKKVAAKKAAAKKAAAKKSAAKKAASKKAAAKKAAKKKAAKKSAKKKAAKKTKKPASCKRSCAERYKRLNGCCKKGH
jgi:pyruvate/2-oxoglutarate dehydrogenase complex dihydrolipoamide acyltransferase (E2) component